MINEDAQDALIRHQVMLLRAANRLAREANDRLAFTEAELRALIATHYGDIPDTSGSAQNLAIDALVGLMLQVRGEAWDAVVTAWLAELNAIVRAEVDLLEAIYNDASPVDLELASATAAGIVAGSRWQGRTVRQHLAQQRQADGALIRAAISTAVEQGETPTVAARILTGTRSQNGRNGALQRTRNQVLTNAKTSVASTTNAARGRFSRANVHVIKKEKFIAVLDGRTTPVCRANSAKVFNQGEGPEPPLHHRCRSIRIPLVDTGDLGSRATNPTTEKGLLREYRDANGLTNIRSRADLPRGHKGAYDAFKRRRIRELAGPIEPADISYQDWLRRQPVQFQEDVLGVQKAKLFRDGQLDLDRFVDDAGDELSLFEMAQRDAEAFRAAGLDPKDPKWASYQRQAAPSTNVA